jgi:hypothetical protein
MASLLCGPRRATFAALIPVLLLLAVWFGSSASLFLSADAQILAAEIEPEQISVPRSGRTGISYLAAETW